VRGACSCSPTVDADHVPTPHPTATDFALSIGSTDGTTWVVVQGRASWKDATALRDTCLEALDAGRSVVVALAACTMLDSTVLGTLQATALGDHTRPVQRTDPQVARLLGQKRAALGARAPVPVRRDAGARVQAPGVAAIAGVGGAPHPSSRVK
jgi:hypothetical protein